jgi:Tfp pilus assembly PilM family ATPase
MSLGALFQSAPPDVAIDIGVARVSVARLSWRDAQAVVAGYASEPLAPGAVVPALAAPNLPDVSVVGRAVTAALGRLGGRPRRAALVIPDTAAKVSLLRFEKVPSRPADLMELVRWQMRKSAPFPMEQAVVSYSAGSAVAEGGQEFIVSAARRDIIEEYESACAQAGVHAGLVDIATFAIINGVLASQTPPTDDWLLVHTTPGYTSLTVLRGSHVIYFRNQGEDAEGSLADVVHQTAMYYEDRLKGAGFSRVWLAGAAAVPGGGDALRRNLEERVGVKVEPVDLRGLATLQDRISAAPELVDALSPLIGILVPEGRAA